MSTERGEAQGGGDGDHTAAQAPQHSGAKSEVSTSDCAWPSSWGEEEEDSHISLLMLANTFPGDSVGLCLVPRMEGHGQLLEDTPSLSLQLPAPEAPMLQSSPGSPRGCSARGGVLLQHCQKEKNN